MIYDAIMATPTDVLADVWRSMYWPHYAVIIPMSAPAEQCNRFMAALEAERYIESVTLSRTADHVILISLDRMRAILGAHYLREPTLLELQRDRAMDMARGLVALWSAVIW